MYQASLSRLKNSGVNLNEAFFSTAFEDVPLLQGIVTLLNSIDSKGLKLTQKGFLPTKVVQSIVEVAATAAEQRFLKFQKRFYEEEHISAQMVRVTAEVIKLVKVQKGRLFLTKKAQEFLALSPHQRFIVLFDSMLDVNMGYFDAHQEALCVHGSSLIMLQLLRDKSHVFRTAEVYSALLIDLYPSLEEEIDTLDARGYGDDDAFDIFVDIVELRLFERLFLPLGLVEMRPAEDYRGEDTFAKSALLDLLIQEKNIINKELLFSKKLLRRFQDEIRQKGLRMDLFEESLFLFAQFAHIPVPPTDAVVDMLIRKHEVGGRLKQEYEQCYTQLIESVLTTYEAFMQLDTVGSKREDLLEAYTQMVDGFAKIVMEPKPFNTVKKLEILPLFVFDILKNQYRLDAQEEDVMSKIEQEFGEEFAMDMGHLLILLTQLKKDAKKLKKNKPFFQEGVKEFIQTYFIVVFELRGHSI